MILRRLYPGRATALPKKLKKPVAEDLRTRGLLVNKAQEALAEAAASEDLKQMAELLGFFACARFGSTKRRSAGVFGAEQFSSTSPRYYYFTLVVR